MTKYMKTFDENIFDHIARDKHVQETDGCVRDTSKRSRIFVKQLKH